MNLNQYAGSGSFIRWHSDNEPLFGPQNSPKLIASLSLGNSVEFKVRRRAPRGVPSSTRLDHGDILVMDGSAQPEYEHCTASELQGPRAGGPTQAGSSAFLGRGLLRIRSRRLGGRAAGGTVSIRQYRVSRGDAVDVHCAQYFVHSSLSPVLLFRRRLKSVADVL